MHPFSLKHYLQYQNSVTPHRLRYLILTIYRRNWHTARYGCQSEVGRTEQNLYLYSVRIISPSDPKKNGSVGCCLTGSVNVEVRFSAGVNLYRNLWDASDWPVFLLSRDFLACCPIRQASGTGSVMAKTL